MPIDGRSKSIEQLHVILYLIALHCSGQRDFRLQSGVPTDDLHQGGPPETALAAHVVLAGIENATTTAIASAGVVPGAAAGAGAVTSTERGTGIGKMEIWMGRRRGL